MGSTTEDVSATGAIDIACLSVAGPHVPLAQLEALSIDRRLLSQALPDLRRRCGATQLVLLTTCERIELYGIGLGEEGPSALARALAGYCGVPVGTVRRAGWLLTGTAAARHLLRVTVGLESFVLGEVDVAGQVRSALSAARAAGVTGLELERLVATAVHTSRRVRQCTRFGASRRSVAAAAVQLADQDLGGLRGRRVLVVGAGDVAGRAVEKATLLGAEVTVCCRHRRRADHLVAAGARVATLDQLPLLMTGAEVAIFGTAAPAPLIDARELTCARGGLHGDLLVLDLCVPRNVDPTVRWVSGVRLLDLADLRSRGMLPEDAVTQSVTLAERIVEEELDRFCRWLARRRATAAVTRLRSDIEACVRRQVAMSTRGVPEEIQPVVADSVRRALRQLGHQPTMRLLAAAEDGDTALVEILADLFRPVDRGTPGSTGLPSPAARR